jgi:hypothetical protein
VWSIRFTVMARFSAPWADASAEDVEVHAKVVQSGGKQIEHIPEPAIPALLAKGLQRDADVVFGKHAADA